MKNVCHILGSSTDIINTMTQPKRKKPSTKPYPEGWDEEEVDRMFQEAAAKLFKGVEQTNGVLRITPAALKKIMDNTGTKK